MNISLSLGYYYRAQLKENSETFDGIDATLNHPAELVGVELSTPFCHRCAHNGLTNTPSKYLLNVESGCQ